ncbi:unnamed protein product [Fraxinus pennsylvanica]|uniref:CLAVATA3/ESR (CLE)-related protein 13 n=1 Tax=Fraxinus pennsylvanica TaxID=56036 RepID=A0AAD1ZIZ0_9LAMI|nr:unnamed protein product [Fraxinus pennsylvanica]
MIDSKTSPDFIAPCFLFKKPFSFTSSHMALRTPHVLCSIIWLFLLLLVLFHEFYGIKYLQNSECNDSSSSSLLVHHPLIHRKTMASTKFDFSPFLNRRHHRKHSQERGPPEIDPCCGVEKRLVPTGPNPLHH